MTYVAIDHPVMSRPAGQAWGAGCLGFAFAGFFDGILLHQIFQWHHLLSGVSDPADLRFQVLADGLFHAAMYAIGSVGLALLWSVRTGFNRPGAGLHLVAWFMVGFGAWHLVDAVLVHWVLGLHRIRQDSATPIVWDLVFFALGLVFTVAGLKARSAAVSFGRQTAPTLAMLVVATGAVALQPLGAPASVVVFREGVAPEAALVAVARAGGTVMAANAEAGVWQVAGATASTLYAEGALFVGAGIAQAACFGG
ncbi:DUF2243 domain-containing protein [Chthonobacter rhizosphaerae]|uniref:DUF2243 domain-containing protein n=1 Tax=Chthonobacter rhizosphaerae TaxID=2735553 RepID=UPI0015EF06C2|nr:DUF2243 domain-containing protein [Chthonobacter rhizosphaerae]